MIFLAFIACKKDQTNNIEVVACYDYSPVNDIQTGDTLTFLNCSENALNYFWDFGEGTTSASESPNHSYLNSGSYLVKLTATHGNFSDTISKIIQITDKYFTNPNDTSLLVNRYDTIFPSDYFPAYPGSYWMYDNNETLKVDSEYIFYKYYKPDCSNEMDSVYLPRMNKSTMFNSGDNFVYVLKNMVSGNKRVPTCGYYGGYTNLYTIVCDCDSLNYALSDKQAGYYNAGYCEFRSDYELNAIKYDSVNISYEYVEPYSPDNWEIKRVFVKHIGLIQYIHRDFRSGDTIKNINLIDYNIKR